MTTKDAKSYGGDEIVKAAFILMLVFEFIYMLIETQGDFANGILFFIDNQMNVYFLLMFIVSFLTLYLFGRQAGHAIIEKDKNYLLVAIRLGLISTLLIISYITIAILLLNQSRDPVHNLEHQREINNAILRLLFILGIPIILVWIYVTNRIKKEGLKS